MRAGTARAADEALAELIARDRDVMAYQIAEVYAWRGEKDKAFEWLQVSLDNHDTGLAEPYDRPVSARFASRRPLQRRARKNRFAAAAMKVREHPVNHRQRSDSLVYVSEKHR